MSTNTAKILRKLMKNEGVNESDLARRTKISQSTLNRILNSETQDPRISSLLALSEYFRVPINYLINHKSHSTVAEPPTAYGFPLTNHDLNLVEQLSQLDKKQKALVESMIRQMNKK